MDVVKVTPLSPLLPPKSNHRHHRTTATQDQPPPAAQCSEGSCVPRGAFLLSTAGSRVRELNLEVHKWKKTLMQKSHMEGLGIFPPLGIGFAPCPLVLAEPEILYLMAGIGSRDLAFPCEMRAYELRARLESTGNLGNYYLLI